ARHFDGPLPASPRLAPRAVQADAFPGPHSGGWFEDATTFSMNRPDHRIGDLGKAALKTHALQASLLQLGIQKLNRGVVCGEWRASGPVIERLSPIDGQVIGRVQTAAAADYEHAVDRAREAFLK